MTWGLVLGLALTNLAQAQFAQKEVPGTSFLRIERAPVDPKWQAGMAEDIEVLRRLLAQTLRHHHAAGQAVLWDADGGGSPKLSAGTITLNGSLGTLGSGTLTLG